LALTLRMVVFSTSWNLPNQESPFIFFSEQ